MKHPLPNSADDLLIKDGKLLMRSLSIYEILRRFSHILRLTVFRFEDFVAALLADDQSALMSEIHIQLLRTLNREDRQQQTWLGPPDIRDSINLYIHLVDHTNWPAALRLYLSADLLLDPVISDHLKESEDGSTCYPFNADLTVKLDVLEQLCDQFLLTVFAREDIVNGSATSEKRESSCRICSKPSKDLITCSKCSASYHFKCSDPTIESSSEDDSKVYTCNSCRSSHVTGVSDCVSLEERSGNLKRHEALGVDVLGRRYWFIARRIFVVDEIEDDVRYYTTKKQFRELIDFVHQNRLDGDLLETLTAQQEEIERQMQITEDLYETQMKDHKNADGTYSLKLGQDGTHRCYSNYYPPNASLAGKVQPQDRDMIRSLGNKFCMTTVSSFKWCGAIDGPLSTITSSIRSTILKLESQLPQTFVHPCWQSRRTEWVKSVNSAHTPRDYAKALAKLEICIKPVLYKSAWYNCVGFTHLFRSTFYEREELKKIDRQPRGFERNERSTADFELSLRLGTMVKFSPKLKPVKHQVWKQKGEEYRLTGLNGWYWQGKTRRSRLRSSPKLFKNESFRWSRSIHNHPFVVDMINERIKSQDVIDISTELNQQDEQQRILYQKIPTFSEWTQLRVDKMEGLLQMKLDQLQRQKEASETTLNLPKKDTSPVKSNGKGDNSQQKSITNGLSLPSNIIDDQSTAVKAIPAGNNIVARSDNKPVVNDCTNSIAISPNKDQQTSLSRVTQAKLLPTHEFLTKYGKVRSIFVLPDSELRRLARSGGFKEARTFSYAAKQNHYIWPYGMTPRPTIRTCWLFRNELINSIQDVALQLKYFYACLRWDDLQVKPPATGHSTIVTDDATITIELLKRRDKLPYLTHSEYLIRKITTPNPESTKYRRVSSTKSTPSARSGLRDRRQVLAEEERKPTREEIWVSEYELDLWELKQFDEKIERQNALIRERALREEAEKRRRSEEQKRRASAELERRRIKMEQEESAKKARISTPIIAFQHSKIATSTTPHLPYRPNINNSINIPPQHQLGPRAPSTPVLRYFRTEQGQIIRLPASYLQRGTPLILRHVSPGTNQTNTYIIRPQTAQIPVRIPTPIVKQELVTKQPQQIPQYQLVPQQQQQQQLQQPLKTQQQPPQLQQQPGTPQLQLILPPNLQLQQHQQQQPPSQQQQKQQLPLPSIVEASASESEKQGSMNEPKNDEVNTEGKSNENVATINGTTVDATASGGGDLVELKTQATSVGTVANELAHDQHASESVEVGPELREGSHVKPE